MQGTQNWAPGVPLQKIPGRRPPLDKGETGVFEVDLCMASLGDYLMVWGLQPKLLSRRTRLKLRLTGHWRRDREVPSSNPL